MKTKVLLSLIFCLVLTVAVSAQNPTSSADSDAVTFPRIMRFSGVLPEKQDGAVVGVTFALYKDQTGGIPLWQEVQNVRTDATGHYSVLLGSTQSEGLPVDLFTANEARWLGIRVENGEEQARIALVSVPYALKAGDAETLGGKPLSAFVLSQVEKNSSTYPTGSTTAITATVGSIGSTTSTIAATSTQTANYIPMFVDAAGTLGNSNIFQNVSGNVGIGQTNPHARLAVGVPSGGEVLSATNLSDNDMLISLSAPGAADKTTYFGPSAPTNLVLGVGGQEKMRIKNNGNVGIGHNNPQARLAIGIPAGGEVLSATNLADNDMLIAVNAPGATDKKTYFGPSAPTNLVLGVGGLEKVRITNAGNVGIGTSTPSNKLSVTGTIESTTGGFKFPDGSVLTSAINQGTSTFTGNTINQILAVTQTGTGTAANFVAQGTGSTAANFTASNSTQTIQATQNGAGVPEFSPSGVPTAVRGDSTSSTGSAAGVFGTSSSSLGYGVTGANNAASCDPNDPNCYAIGMFGFSGINGLNGTGVWGEAEAPSGSTVGVFGKSLADKGTGVYGYASSSAANSDATGVYGLSAASGGTGVFGEVNSPSGTPAAVYGLVSAGTGVGAQFDVQTGNILIGRSWNGSVYANVFRVTSDGTTYGKVFNTQGADFAESVAINGGKSLYSPGDVLIVDESGTRRFALANKPYSTKVAGIYATQPGVLASTHRDGDPQLKEEVPLAIVGIVPCKVSAENGAIKAGDLLVASSRPGYAMKGTDRNRMLGAVVGKALGSLDKGTGVIEVLVSLH